MIKSEKVSVKSRGRQEGKSRALVRLQYEVEVEAPEMPAPRSASPGDEYDKMRDEVVRARKGHRDKLALIALEEASSQLRDRLGESKPAPKPKPAAPPRRKEE